MRDQQAGTKPEPRSAAFPAAGPQSFGRGPGAQHLHGRQQAAAQAHYSCHARCEQPNARIGRGAGRERRQDKRPQQRGDPVAHEQRRARAGGAEDQAFAEQLCEQSATTGAQRLSKRQFRPAFPRPHQQQARNICGGDHQDAARHHREPQGNLHFERALLIPGAQQRAEAHDLAVGLDAAGHPAPLVGGVGLAIRGFAAHAGLEPGDDLYPIGAAVGGPAPPVVTPGNGAERQPEIRAAQLHAGEAGRRDANHFVVLAAESERAPEGVVPSGEMPLPELVTDDDHGLGVGLAVLGRREEPALGRCHAEQAKEAGRGPRSGKFLRLRPRAERRVHAGLVGRDCRQRMGAVPQINVVWEGAILARPPPLRIDPDQTFGLRYVRRRP